MSYRILKTYVGVLLSDAEGIPLEWDTYEGARAVVDRMGGGYSIVYPQSVKGNSHKVPSELLSMSEPSDKSKKID